MNRVRLLGAAALALALLSLFAGIRSGAASAHPLGNFTINQFARLDLYRGAVRVHYVVDMAEIPTYQEMGTLDGNANGDVSDAEAAAYVDRTAPELMANLHLQADGREVGLKRLAGMVILVDGQAGLKTLRIALDLEGRGLATGVAAFQFRNDNFADRLGWREIVVAPGEGVSFEGADTPATSVTNELRKYPDDMLSSPLDVRESGFSFDPGTGATAPAVATSAPVEAPAEIPSGFGGQAFADLISVDQLSLPIIVLSLLVAFALGGVHALSPGHGKTIVAAYFVGSGGTPRQAVALAATVTLAHTTGVLALGAVTLYLSEYILPEDLYPLLTLGSGLVLIAFGITLLWMRVQQQKASRRSHAVSSAHAHGPGEHHDHDSMTALEHARAHLGGRTAAEGMPWRSLLALGISGGILPSPTALIVLLGAISLHRLGFGILLILAFSLGLATVLTSVGLAFVVAQRLMSRLPVSARLVNAAPTAAAIAITVFGAVLATRADRRIEPAQPKRHECDA